MIINVIGTKNREISTFKEFKIISNVKITKEICKPKKYICISRPLKIDNTENTKAKLYSL